MRIQREALDRLLKPMQSDAAPQAAPEEATYLKEGAAVHAAADLGQTPASAQAIIGGVALRLVQLPPEDIRFVAQMVARLQQQHQATPSSRLSPVEIVAEARRRAALLDDVPPGSRYWQRRSVSRPLPRARPSREIGLVTEPIRAVFNTNVLVSALLSRDPTSPAQELMRRWRAEEFVLLVSQALLIELVEKLHARSIGQDPMQELLTTISRLAGWVDVPPEAVVPVITADPDDDQILTCAVHNLNHAPRPADSSDCVNAASCALNLELSRGGRVWYNSDQALGPGRLSSAKNPPPNCVTRGKASHATAPNAVSHDCESL
jgi:predicted nucleic acid-binding protein